MPFLGEFICLGIDAAILTIVYKFYKDASKTLQSVKNAPTLEITDLKHEAEKYAQGCIPYAIVRGTVKAFGMPLASKNVPSGPAGVIHESILREHKIQWSWASRWWREVKEDITRTTNAVPFMLRSEGGAAFIEVTEPLSAKGWELHTIYDEFEPSKAGFWSAITRFFIGETTTGYQRIEKMLPEGSVLTGVGALVLRHDKISLRPPARGLSYYLTQMSEDSLLRNLESEASTLRTLVILFGTFGGVILGVILVKYYQKRREQAERSAELRRMREMLDRQNVQREENGVGEEELGPDRLCVVCQENPREVLILECGHLCCCANCGQMLDPAICPVCRAQITRLVPAFQP